MGDARIPRERMEQLALRAMAGERVPLMLGRRRYTLTVDPIFRVEAGSDGFLFLCSGLRSLARRLEALALSPGASLDPTSATLGGERGPH